METMHRRWAVRRGSGIMERRSPSILTLSPWRGRMGMLLLAIGFLISLVGVHQETDRLVEGKTIREFKCPAFFMPESTKRVDILLREAGFTDSTQWKR